MRTLAALPLALVFLVPLAVSLLFILPDVTHGPAYAALVAHPQFSGALRLTLVTGLASTALALVLAIATVFAAGGANLARRAGIFLAVPHLSLAIGLAFLIMPAGLVARFAALVLGWTEPPQWVTTQDPWGLALIAALVLKETPFLVWAFASLLNRDDLRRSFEGQGAVARSLGHGATSTFLRVVLPQLLPRALGPLIAVLAYGLTVVDMALVIGPTQPPTLAQLTWTDLNDADPQTAARGSAGVIVLGGLVLLAFVIAGALLRALRPARHRFYAAHPRAGHGRAWPLSLIWPAWLCIYGAVIAVMLLHSVAAQWPFPHLLPAAATGRAWVQLLTTAGPFVTSLLLALATSWAAIVATVIYLEWSPDFDALVTAAAVAVLCIPALLLALGEYRLFLRSDLTGTATAMFVAHVLPVTAYVFLLLAAPYRAFDARWQSAAAGLQVRRLRFLLRIKWPMLKAPILAAGAVGFAVSVAQYVPAQLASVGRYSTLPMDAVTLSAGGNRPLLAVYGLALMALPLAALLLASHFGKARWSSR